MCLVLCKEKKAHMCDGHNVREYNIVTALIYSCQQVWATK
jgi:hypothetical protein